MSEITNYKCPSCTGPLHFVGSSGMLECDYCESKFEVAEIEKLYAEEVAKAEAATAKIKEDEAKMKADAANGDPADQFAIDAAEEWGPGEGMRSYSCPSCGAELVCDESTAATCCPYCGNQTVVPGQFSGMLKPDYIIPFKLDKQAAVDALTKHYKGKVLLPKSFKDGNHIEEIQGVYVPFWLFDGVADGSASFAATKSRTYTSGEYRITETRHYNCYRSGNMAFEKVPADGSSRMPDTHMDSIEPYNYEELKSFSTAYMPGFLADKYDVDAASVAPRIHERCESSLVSALRGTVTGFDTVSTTGQSVHVDDGKVHYAMMPVWLLSTKWNDQNFLFAMNGQTGKLVGDLPVSKPKAVGIFAAVFIALFILIFMFIGG